MSKVMVLFAEGFEEIEGLTIVDILRRAEIACDMISIGERLVKGSHDIVVQVDGMLADGMQDFYDMVVLPGGLPGATNLHDDAHVIALLQEMDRQGKFVCAMCAAPIVLAKAGLLEGRQFTAYVGYDKQIQTTGTFLEDIVVRDGNLITSRGPATSFAFAYAIAEALGKDTSALREKMLYSQVVGR